jgi:hypothetical protein
MYQILELLNGMIYAFIQEIKDVRSGTHGTVPWSSAYQKVQRASLLDIARDVEPGVSQSRQRENEPNDVGSMHVDGNTRPVDDARSVMTCNRE